MTTYDCKGFRPIRAASHGEAASKFALRLARRRFGINGRVFSLWNQRHGKDGGEVWYVTVCRPSRLYGWDVDTIQLTTYGRSA